MDEQACGEGREGGHFWPDVCSPACVQTAYFTHDDDFITRHLAGKLMGEIGVEIARVDEDLGRS